MTRLLDPAGRTEADIQSDIRLALLAGGLDLSDAQVVALEVPAGDGTRRRIDIRAGFCLIEVKRDLGKPGVLGDAVTQLAGYVTSLTAAHQQRYVGVLSDGVRWLLYQPVGQSLELVSEFTLTGAVDAADRWRLWIDGVLATRHQITPTPAEIEARLGAGSSGYQLDLATLDALWRTAKGIPEVQLKRSLWAKLLTTAFGTHFVDADALFVQHTYLVVSAEIIAHCAVGFDVTDPQISPQALVSGVLFQQAQIAGVVESDFFDWLIHHPDGVRFITALARRLARFDWAAVEHDVLKVLYEAVISAEQRHSLGEYYTPDWLAHRVVAAVVDDPLQQRVADFSCGSGAFLFAAVRRYLSAADTAGIAPADAITHVTRQVIGVDVHPVAVTLARVTYLLAIGLDRIADPNRPPLAIPVYLGDSLQWDQHTGMLSHGEIRVPTDDGQIMFGADDLVFPEAVITDAGSFDLLVNELVDKATSRPDNKVPSIGPVLARYGLSGADAATITATFKVMCHLHDSGRNHIWGYYVRNLIRPLWLARPENRVHRIVGNPPWLSYRYMTPAMQQSFKAACKERQLWTGRNVATHQDLSGLFVARAVELYLAVDGRFGLVLPRAVLTGPAYAGFRTGHWSTPTFSGLDVTFDTPWDLEPVQPTPFPVPAAVAFGTNTPTQAGPMPTDTVVWSGRLPKVMVGWDVAQPLLTTAPGGIATRPDEASSLYAARFRNGATCYPRRLVCVQQAKASPLGVGAGRAAVISASTRDENEPWSTVPLLHGVVEQQFLWGLQVGQTILPFRALPPWLTLTPHDGTHLYGDGGFRHGTHPGFDDWWDRASRVWDTHKKPQTKLTLTERVDYQRGLSGQMPVAAPHRVVYAASGGNLTACRIGPERTIVDNSAFWAACTTIAEARYLTAIFNSDAIVDTIRRYQPPGQFGPRHFHKHVFHAPIPLFDPTDPHHQSLAVAAEEAEQVAALIDATGYFVTARRRVRDALTAAGITQRINTAVADLFAP